MRDRVADQETALASGSLASAIASAKPQEALAALALVGAAEASSGESPHNP